MKAIRIFPSILTADFDRLPAEIARVAQSADFIHLDIMDNIFVPNFTFDFARTNEIIDESVLPIDLHLMVANADEEAPKFATSNAKSVTFHFEACKDVPSTLAKVRELGKRVGIAIKPNTPVDVLYPYLSKLDMITVMTVEPGFGGQKFMAEMLPKVKSAREWLTKAGLSDVWLQLDGGISLKTIKAGFEAGADTFVAGSAVYPALDPAQKVSELKNFCS